MAQKFNYAPWSQELHLALVSIGTLCHQRDMSADEAKAVFLAGLAASDVLEWKRAIGKANDERRGEGRVGS